jgi:phosphate transport system substrate-binding protein
MNDDFLQRMRVAPPPEFLADLKVRLDRQKLAPAPPPQRSALRALIAAFVLGAATVAAASLAWKVLPRLWGTPSPEAGDPYTQQAHSDSTPAPAPGERAPVQLVAPHRSRHGTSPDWDFSPSPSEPAGPSAASAPTASGLPSEVTHGGSAAPSVSAEPARSVLLGGPRDYVRIVGSPALQPYTTRVIEQFQKRSSKPPRMDIESSAAGLSELCAAGAADSPDVAQAARPITAAELQTCTKSGAGVIELPLGHEAVVLTRAKLYGPLKLSPREVFLALAKRVPDPAHPQSTVENPNTTWNQVNDALPYDRIAVFGPELDSPLGRAFLDLLVEKGCNTYPALVALRDLDEAQYDTVCRTLRDGVYTVAPDVSSRLEMNPTALGVSSLPGFVANSARLVGISIAGIEVSRASIESGAYPASRSLFLYVRRDHLYSVPGLKDFVWAYWAMVDSPYVNEKWRYEGPGWALLPLDKAARDATRRDLMMQKTLNPD